MEGEHKMIKKIGDNTYSLETVLQNKFGLHVNPIKKLAFIAKDYSCKVSVRNERDTDITNEEGKYILYDKEYVRVSIGTILDMIGGLKAPKGDILEFIAEGDAEECNKCLYAIEDEVINNKFGEK